LIIVSVPDLSSIPPSGMKVKSSDCCAFSGQVLNPIVIP
jgi:hypothetical protein